MNANSPGDVERTTQARNAFRAGVLGTAACAAVLPLYLYIALRQGAWQLYVFAGSFLLIGLSAVAMLVTSRQGRHHLGVELAIGAVIISGLVNVTVIEGMGLASAAGIVAITVVVGGSTLPSRRAGQALVVVTIVGCLVLLYDLLGFPGRLPVPEDILRLVLAGTGVSVLVTALPLVRRFRDYTLRTKLIVVWLGVAGVAIASSGVLVDRSTRGSLVTNVGQDLASLAGSQALAIGDHLGNQQDTLRVLVLDPALQEAARAANAAYPADPAAARAEVERLDALWRGANEADALTQARLTNPPSVLLRDYARAFAATEQVYLADRYGGLVAGTHRPPGYDQSGEAWWQAAYNAGAGGFYIGPPELDEATATYRSLLAVPVRTGDQEQVIGVVGAVVNLKSIASILEAGSIGLTRRAELLAGGRLLDRQQGPDPADALLQQALEAMAREGALYTEVSREGRPYFVSQAPVLPSDPEKAAALNRLGWSVIVFQRQDEALAPAETARRTILAVGLVAAMVSVLLAVFIAGRLSEPVTRLTAVAERISAGDLTAQADAEGQDEIGKLGRAFNAMTAILEQRVAERTRALADANQALETEIEVRRQAEDKFRSLVESLPDAILIVDEAGQIRFANSRLETLFGYTQSEVIGQPVEILIPERYRGSHPGQRRAFAAGPYLRQMSARLDLVGLHKEAREFPVEVGLGPVLSPEGLSTTVIVHDITERRQFEAALRDSEERFRWLFTASPDAIVLLDPHDPDVLWPVVDCNDAACRMNGYTREALTGRSINLLNVTQGTRAAFDAVLDYLRREGTIHTETNRRHQDGRIIPVEYASTLVSIGGRELVLTTDRDITERTQFEMALRDSEERFRRLFAASPDAVILIDPIIGAVSWPIVDCNEAACQMNGYTREALIGQSIDILNIAPGTPEERDAYLARLRAAGVISLEVLHRHQDGHVFPVEVSTSLIHSGGRDLVLGIDRDITERKRAEDALRLSEERFQLVTYATNDAIWDLTLKTGQRWWNTGIRSRYGYVQDQVREDQSWWEERIHPEERAKVLDSFQAALQSDGQFWSKEYRFRRADGTYADVFDRGYVMQGEHGQPSRIIGAMMDLSERKRAEEALRQSEELFSKAFNSSPAAMAIVQLESDRYLDVNTRWEQLFGWQRHAALGRTVFDLNLYVDAGARERIKALAREHETAHDREVVCRIKSGERRDMLLSMQLVSVQGETCLLSTFSDITERKRTEVALRELNEKLKRSFAELEQHSRDIELLNTLADLLQACSGMDEAYPIIAEQGRRLLGEDSGALYLVNPSRDLLEVAVTWGPAGPGERVFAPGQCWAWRRARAHLAGAGGPGPACQHYARAPGDAHLCVPLVAQEGAFGLLHLSRASAGGEAAFSEARQRLAQAMSETVSLALANLNLRETLRSQSIRDPLTGLFNRRYMQESLERELLRATRSSYSIGIVMLDIDHFKHFNDTFGHAAGDLMLRELGSFLKRHVRGGDILCRYGGEEFTLILPEASLAIARQRAEQLHESVRQLHVTYRGQPLGPITISMGVAAFPEHGAAADTLLRVADEALYRAKHAGRDRVVVAG